MKSGKSQPMIEAEIIKLAKLDLGLFHGSGHHIQSSESWIIYVHLPTVPQLQDNTEVHSSASQAISSQNKSSQTMRYTDIVKTP